MVFVSVTRLHLKSPLYLPLFVGNVALSTWQILNTPGFLSGRLLQDSNLTFWTLTLWEEAAAMKFYRTSGAHRSAMLQIQNWCDESSFVHWSQEDSNLPNWLESHRRILKNGWFTQLPQPSQAHLERQISKPKSAEGGLPLRPWRKRLPNLT